MTEARETIQIVEIRQPRCALAYGVSPCTAAGAASESCFNTYTTCQDKENYTASTLSLFFSRGHVAERYVDGATYVIPSLLSVSTAPTRVNISASNRDYSGLGVRASVQVQFQDHPHDDFLVDPYRASRDYTPIDRASFWSKWIARNKFRLGIEIVVYEGLSGDALADMRTRTYEMTSISGPGSSGRVTIEGKDILSRLEERKSQAPAASPGALRLAAAADASVLTLAGATAADYPAPGWVRINDEIVYFTAVGDSTQDLAEDGDIDLTGLVRGGQGTDAREHDVEDAVQLCLRYDEQSIAPIIYDLLETHGGIDAGKIDKTGINLELLLYRAQYKLRALISSPVSVAQLISEIQTHAQIIVFWDERVGKVRAKAIKGLVEAAPLLTAEAHIVEGSFSVVDSEASRVSQVRLYYSPRTPVAPDDEPASYRRAAVAADLGSEGALEYGAPSVLTIFSRWLIDTQIATITARSIVKRYRDGPRRAQFTLAAKDIALWVGDVVGLSHHLDVDEFGARRLGYWTIVSAEEHMPGEAARYTAEETTQFGVVGRIMANDAADYDASTADMFGCYIHDNDGLLSDGRIGATIG